MAKTVFIGVGGVARKVKKVYVGVGGKARKVKKAWVGVGGKARLCFSGGEPKYYGTVTSLSQVREELAAVSVGNYALFAGGLNASKAVMATVDAYNASLVRSTPTALSVARRFLAGAAIGNYALFAGGINYSGTKYATVDAYNTSLVRSTPTALQAARPTSWCPAVSTGNHAIFGGGKEAVTSDAYNAALVRTAVTTPYLIGVLSASIGGYALFAGGRNGGTMGSNAVSVTTLSSTLVAGNAPDMASARTDGDGTNNDNYALLGGGYGASGAGVLSTVETYNKTLVKGNVISMSGAKQSYYGKFACSVQGIGIFGASQGVSYHDTYKDDLIRKSFASAISNTNACAAVGDFALFEETKSVNYSPSSTIVDAMQVE